MLPQRGWRALALLACLSLPTLSGCLAPRLTAAAAAAGDAADRDCDLVPDARDYLVRAACDAHDAAPARGARYRVAFALVAREPDRATDAELRRLDALAPTLAKQFERAARGLVALDVVAPARVLPAPPVPSLDEDPAALVRAYFGAKDAPRDVHFLVLVAADVPVAGERCGCVAWHQRARNPSLLGAAFEDARAFGAPPAFVGVTALGTLAELDDPVETQYRFLHETAHAWCCRLPRDDSHAERLLAERGSHWSLALRDASRARDPLLGDGTTRPGSGAWALSDLTLVAMGALAPADARAAVAPGGKLVSAADVLALGRA